MMRLNRESLSALILVLMFALIRAENAPPKFDLTGRSFTLSGIINRISKIPAQPVDGDDADDGINLVQFFETYSITQQQAIIRLNRARGLPSSNLDQQCLGGDFYLDKTGAHLFFWDRTQRKCRQPSGDSEIMESLLGEQLDLGKLGSPELDNIVLGAARLLFLVGENWEKMINIMDTDPDDDKSSIQSRVFKILSNGGLEIHAYFDNQALIEKKNPLPHQIVVQTDKSKIIISYKKVVFLPDDQGGNFTEFAHLADCLKNPDPVEFFTELDRSNLEFSFRAQLGRFDDAGSSQDETILAYSARLGKLRFNSPILGAQQSIGSTEVKRQIWDLKANRVYQIIALADGSNNIIDQVLRLGDNQQVGGSSNQGFACSIARISPSSSGLFEKATSSQLLFGASKFTLTNKTKLHGIEALVYKASDPVPPFWLDNQWTIQDGALEQINRQQSASEGKQPESEAGSSLAGAKDDLVLETKIYLSENGTNHRNHEPLLIKFEWKQRDSLEVVKKRLVPITDFAWNLSASSSSNNERPSELFSVNNLCPSRFAEPAKVRLLLSNQLSSARILPDSLSAESRNQILLRAIQETLEIQTTSISELESEMIENDDDGSMLSASFKASELSEVLVEPIYIDRGKFVASANERISVPIDSFDMCFLLASYRPVPILFGYDFKDKICHIDLESVASQSIESSKGFTRSHYGSVHIFKVNHQIDSERLSLTRWIENKFGPESGLVGKSFRLSISDQAGNSTSRLKIMQASIDGRDFGTIKDLSPDR